VQTAAILAGYTTSISEGNESLRNPSYSNCYKLHMTKRSHMSRSHAIKKYEYGYTGNVYCVSVPSGMIMTRYNNQTFISGNCIHAKVGIEIVNTIRKELPDLFDKDLEDRILHEAEEAFKAESKIVDWMLGDYEGKDLNKDILKEFIKNRINVSLSEIGFKKIFDIDKDLLAQTTWFEEMTIGDNLVDFFNSRPVDYSKSNQSFDPDNLF
jgi:ribonucleotide reductase beta subunit family protein with ferritin-like domain